MAGVALVAACTAVCGLTAALVHGAGFPVGVWAILTVSSVVAGTVDVELDDRVFVGPGFAFGIFATVYLGPAAVLSMFAVSEVVRSLVRRPRPMGFVANIVANSAPTMLAATVVSSLTGHLGLRSAGFYVALAALAVALLVATFYLVSLSMILYYGTREWRAVAPWRFGLPLLTLVLATELAVRVYVTSKPLGLAVLLLGAAGFAASAQLVRDARRSARVNAELAAARGVLLAEALAAEDRERRYLAELLHDDAIQTMVAARQDVEDAVDGRADRLPHAVHAIAETLNRLRGAIAEIHPAVLERIGLEAALAAVLEDHARRGFAWSLDVTGDASGVADRLLFSIARELIANAAKHAQPKHVDVAVGGDPVRLTLVVRDDGTGFQPDEVATTSPGHLGLMSVTERARAAGGEVQISSAIGCGTEIEVTVARPAEARAV